MTALRSITIAALLPAAASAQPEARIATMVPDTAWLIVEIHDVDASWERLKGTSLGSIAEIPALRELIEQESAEDMDKFYERLDKLGIDLDDAEFPEGAAGLAILADIPEDWNPEDDDLSSASNALFMIDFGQHADFYEDAIESALEEAEDDGFITTRINDFDEIEIISITEAVDDEDREPVEIDHDDDGIIDEVYEPDEPFELHIAFTDGVLVGGTSLDTIHTGLDGLAGELPATLAATDLYNETRALSGSGEDMFFYANTDAVWEFIQIAAENDETGDGNMAVAVIDALGLTTTRSLGMTIGIDTPAGEIEQEGIVLISEMRGLWSLLGTDTGSWRPGPIASSDASSAGRFVFDFAGIFPLARQVIAAMPEEARAETAMPMAMAEGAAGPVLASFSNEIEFAQRIVRPYSAESQRGGVSIATNDPQPLLGTLNAFGAQAGLQPREFAGGQIFDSENPIVPITVGVSGGQTVIGDVSTVERTLRAAGDEASSLANDARFLEATSWFTPGAFSDSYTRSDETVRYILWTLANTDEITRQQFREMGWEEDRINEVFGEPERPEWADKIDPDDIASRIGDSAAQAHVVKEGIRFRSILGRPAAR